MSPAASRALYIALFHFILGFRFQELKILRAATSKKPTSPLDISYWSAVPYRLGSAAVKYSARPVVSPTPISSPGTSQDCLREAMKKQLSEGEARFDLLVQVGTTADKTPIEDACVEWKEADAPFRKLARIVIPQQVFDTAEQMQFCENLSYTPWHSLPEHRPIGGINRARKVTYELISRYRHELNAAPRKEPEST